MSWPGLCLKKGTLSNYGCGDGMRWPEPKETLILDMHGNMTTLSAELPLAPTKYLECWSHRPKTSHRATLSVGRSGISGRVGDALVDALRQEVRPVRCGQQLLEVAGREEASRRWARRKWHCYPSVQSPNSPGGCFRTSKDVMMSSNAIILV